MHASAASHYRSTSRRSRQRSRAQSDPGHPYVTPPYTIQWPAPARRTTEPMIVTAGTPHQQPPTSGSSEPTEPTLEDPFRVVPRPASLLAQYQASNSSRGTSSSSPVSLRPSLSQRSGLQRSPSKQGNNRAPQAPGSLIKEVPRPSRTAFNIPTMAMSASEEPEAQEQAIPIHIQPPSPSIASSYQLSAGVQRQGSHHSIHQQPLASMYQDASTTTSFQSPSFSFPSPITTHHISYHHRSRSRPPSAASHRYASSITPPLYGHGSSATVDASRIPLNGGVSSHRNHHTTSPPPSTSVLHHASTGSAHISSGSPQRSRSRTRVPPPSTEGLVPVAQSTHQAEKTPSSPPRPARAAHEFRRTTQRPALPANYDGETQTRYVSMLLALDGISPLFNILAAFFTWILLAGFLLFPGTFASWKDEPAGTPQSDILGVINHVSLYVIAWICTGVGGCGMLWLWWRWQGNYIWIANRIFIPGCLNSLAGVISTLSSVYGVQAGVFGESEKSTIIVTGALSVACGILALVYELLIRNLKLEHDREVGVEMAGKHGEGVMGEKDSNL